MLMRSGDGIRMGRALLFGVLACLAVLLAGCSRSASTQEQGAEAPAAQPNMIFVLADDLDLASAEQLPLVRSLLAEEGVTFENAFVSYPICCPARATILTGLYSHNNGVRGNKRPVGGFE